MEKTYKYATLFFGLIITVSLIIFAYFAFHLGYIWIGIILICIIVAASTVNVLTIRKL